MDRRASLTTVSTFTEANRDVSVSFRLKGRICSTISFPLTPAR